MKKATPSAPVANPPTTSKSRSAKSLAKYEETEAFIAVPPDGGWGWLIVLGTFYAFLISDGVIFSFGLFLNEMATALNCTKTQVSLAVAIQTCFYSLMGPLSAALVNRFGYRVVATIGCLLASIACGLTSISTKIYQVIILYGVLAGTGFGMTYVSSLIVVGFYFERWRALASGISLCGAGIGGTVLPPLLHMVVDKYGWRIAFRLMALLILSTVVGTALFRPLKSIRVTIEQETGAVKRNLSHISEMQETKSKMSQFFIEYNNAMFPTVDDVSTSVIALLRPQKRPSLTRSISSEIMTTTLIAEASQLTSRKGATAKSKCCACCRKCCGKDKQPKEPSDMKVAKDSKIQSELKPPRESKMGKFSYAGSNIQPLDAPARPMYRDDIFFSGSVAALPEYKKSQATRSVESQKTKSVLEYHISVTRTTTPYDVEQQEKCHLCPEAMKRTLATMLDCRMLGSRSFILLTVNAILVSYAFYIPFMFIKDRAIQSGIPSNPASWLISAMGGTNTVGRIFCGILSTSTQISASAICAVFLFVGGVAMVLSGISFEIWYQFLFASIYGLSISSVSTLRTVIIVDILGLHKLTNAIGMTLLFQGMASLLGTALAAVFRDATGDYDLTFYTAGAALCVSSFFLIPLIVVTKREKKKLRSTYKI